MFLNMSKHLSENCKWQLTLNGKNIKLDDKPFYGTVQEEEANLDRYLLTHLDEFNDEGEGLLSVSPQDVTTEKVNSLKSEIDKLKKPLKTKVLDGSGEVEDSERFFIEGTIGVTRAISELLLNGTKPLVTGLNIESFKTNRVAALLDGKTLIAPNGKTFQELQGKDTAEEFIAKEIASWESLTDYGTHIHKVFEDIFNDREPSNPGLPTKIFEDLVHQVQKFKSNLKNEYGSNARFYPEFLVKAKEELLSDDAKVALNAAGCSSFSGVIDLLVVDDKGIGHIVDFKVSRKGIAEEGSSTDELIKAWNNKENLPNSKLWHSTKKLSAGYQTEIYKYICEQYGIPIKDTMIVPIKIDLEYNDASNPFLATDLTRVSVATSKSEWIQKPLNSEGKQKIRNLFVTPAKETPEDVETASRIYNAFWPLQGWSMKREEMRSSIEFYKKNTRYVSKLDKDDPKYQKQISEGNTYKIKFPGQKLRYCKAEEVDGILQEFINKRNDTAAEKFLDIAEAIQDVKDGGSVEKLASVVGQENDAFIRSALKRYIDDDAWTLISDDSCHSIGLLIFRKGDKSEIVCLSNEHLRETAPLAKGTSILGQTKADKNVDSRKILPALKGNLAIMRALIYVSQHQDLFENAPIAEIRAIAPWHRGIHSVANELLLNNYSELVREHPNVGALKIKAGTFMSDYDSLIAGCEEEIEDLNLRKDGEDWYSAEWFLEKIKYIKSHYSDEIQTSEEDSYQDTPAGRVLARLQEGYNLARGFRSHTELDKDSYITGHWYELNGLMITSPQYSASANIRELGQAIDEYAKEVRRQITEIGWPMKVAFDKLYKAHGVGAKTFRSWFKNIETLELKDPDCGDFEGDPTSKEALRLFLRTMCQLRHPDFTTEEQFENAKNDEDYYLVPLLEAKFSRQVAGTNLWTAIKNKLKENWAIVDGLFGEEADLYVSKNQEVYNKLKYDTVAARDEILKQHSGAFETDLELVMNAMLVAFCRSNVSRNYIPVIAGLKVGLDRIDALGGDKNVNMKNIRETFDKIVKSKFYGDTLVPKNLQPFYRFLSMVKSCFTTLSLSLNTRSFFRESLQGIYSGIVRSGFKMYPGINEKHYLDALTYVVKESPKNFSSISMLQQMNELYGMANQSLTQIANQRRLRWANIKHWSKDTLFITATAPDFMHRMSILVAKMKADGCFDAHSLVDGKLVYDFHKDKRFQHFLNNEFTHPDYLKEKSLYETMIDNFNTEGFRNKDGSKLDASKKDALPQAYTRTEGQSVKNYADLLYGHYDEESKSLLYDTFLGSFFLQYKTYLTSRLEQWTMHEGEYNVANLTQMKDADGNEMYIKFYEDEDGRPHKDILLKQDYENLSEEEKAKCRLYYDYEGLPLQGMLQESCKVYKSVLGLMKPGGKEKLKEIWSDPTTRTMFKLQLNDLWLCAMLTFLVNILFGLGEDVDEPWKSKKVREAVRKAGPVENFTYSVITGSLADSQLQNVLGAFTDDPPTITAVTKFCKTSMGLMTGDMSFAYWLTRNIGAIGDFQGMAEAYNQQK